jgi:hypothetical protein
MSTVIPFDLDNQKKCESCVLAKPNQLLALAETVVHVW